MDEDHHWDKLQVTHTRDKEKIKFRLLTILDETDLLIQPIRSLGSRKLLLDEIIRSIHHMPRCIKAMYKTDRDTVVFSLAKLATIAKNNEPYKHAYYEKTASRLLRNEDLYIIDVHDKLNGPFLLSDLLRDQSGLYSDGTVEERLLDYDKFQEHLSKCGYNPYRHRINLCYVETSSDGVFESIETNRVYNCSSWISAVIEVQNALQDTLEPFEFHIIDAEGQDCMVCF